MICRNFRIDCVLHNQIRNVQDETSADFISWGFLGDMKRCFSGSKNGGVYTRYADDITISFNTQPEDLNRFIGYCFNTIGKLGFTPHVGKKFSVRRFYRRQMVTGLVVNQKAQLPRETRRWLRAVEHRIQVIKDGDVLGNRPTLSHNQLEGWKSLQEMISR
ncbi:MAG: hypothetical protein P8J33_17955 [Pirellulaceae bacterium]|nr:hypothetical protein [Pirellulaceae bacterium]